jgi:CheY-like chemotaxis protein
MQMARVLVSDDDDLISEMLTIALVSAGHEVKAVSSGRRALDALETGTFDLVITDLFMADGDGTELIMSMRARGHATPVLGISGGANNLFSPFAKAMVAVGADKVMRKPFTPAELFATLNSMLAEQETR